MRWRAVVAALDGAELLRSRVSVYLHPLGGRPILWHVVRSLLDVTPAPESVTIVHDEDVAAGLGEALPGVTYAPAPHGGSAAVALRAAIEGHDVLTLVVDGAAPLLAAGTLELLLRQGEQGPVSIPDVAEPGRRLASAAAAGLLLAADDARWLPGAAMLATADEERLRIVDRHSLSQAAVAVRDRLIGEHERRGVSFLLPATTWVDVDVRIGPDTIVYPGCVLEGPTVIGSECVIGPHSRLVEATVGGGAELKGWNYVSRSTVRNHAVMEPHERRSID